MAKKNGYDVEKDVTVLTRKAVEPLWREALTQARSWGRKAKRGLKNPFFRTNILFSDSSGEEIVIICFPDGKAKIHHFTRVESSALGKKTAELLQASGIPFEE